MKMYEEDWIILGVVVLIVGFLGIVVVGATMGVKADNAFIEKCRFAGGIPVIGRDGRLCHKPGSLIDVGRPSDVERD